MKFIVLALGSAGDVHPNVGLARALKQRGHRVTLVASSVFRELSERSGLDFFGLGTDEEYSAIVRNPDLWHATKAFPLIGRHLILKWMRPTFEYIAKNHEPGRTVVVAPGTAFGARIAHEKLGVPLATVHLQPSILRSSIDPACYSIPDLLAPLPVWLRRLYYRLMDKVAIDRMLAGETNAFRRELGLREVHRLFDGWLHSPQLVIGLFPEWFAPQPLDWPANFHYTGFPLWDEADVRPPSQELEGFLASGAPPWVFTAGSAMMHGHNFFRIAAEVCRTSGRRGLLLAQFREQIPSSLPDGVKYFEYIPFSQVLPRAAALVHHGGIGTTAQALAAGIPQIVMPFAHDQFDSAKRVKKLGVGDYLLPKRLELKTLRNALAHVSGSAEVLANCKRRAAALQKIGALEVTCRLLESLTN